MQDLRPNNDGWSTLYDYNSPLTGYSWYRSSNPQPVWRRLQCCFGPSLKSITDDSASQTKVPLKAGGYLTPASITQNQSAVAILSSWRRDYLLFHVVLWDVSIFALKRVLAWATILLHDRNVYFDNLLIHLEFTTQSTLPKSYISATWTVISSKDSLM